MKRRLRSRFDLLHPEVSKKVESQQEKQVESHDYSRPLRSFKVNAKVYAKNLTTNTPKWITGIVTKITGPLLYVIQLEDGRIVCRHVNHVKIREVFIADPGVSSDPAPETSPADPPQDDTIVSNTGQEDDPVLTDLRSARAPNSFSK